MSSPDGFALRGRESDEGDPVPPSEDEGWVDGHYPTPGCRVGGRGETRMKRGEGRRRGERERWRGRRKAAPPVVCLRVTEAATRALREAEFC